ncbi:unnamed protein product [Trichogramma brassicae]|uniref:Uncharacterized protein n=1 Tax=Trichogramma brassicae TaxID=86971 RepID=A0A6H5IUP3_9HYME|nr:unnamed protein product [Trichogramma brassicae]
MHANTRARVLMPRTEHTCDTTRIRREMADAAGRDEKQEMATIRQAHGNNEKRRRSDGRDENEKRCRSTTSADRRTKPKHAYATMHANTRDMQLSRPRLTDNRRRARQLNTRVCATMHANTQQARAQTRWRLPTIRYGPTRRSCHEFYTLSITQTCTHATDQTMF